LYSLDLLFKEANISALSATLIVWGGGTNLLRTNKENFRQMDTTLELWRTLTKAKSNFHPLCYYGGGTSNQSRA
jgi:hypothetical protein